ncbi:unnamed protein product [Owenia fusiformis]|uniref:Uncharacterized protein n=1 Tax=Owenia fusiformis TaxID=6347 RepID=A0A8J1TE06_OWEFU|nr:unnamed protein product [Owenia fusiformis]
MTGYNTILQFAALITWSAVQESVVEANLQNAVYEFKPLIIQTEAELDVLRDIYYDKILKAPNRRLDKLKRQFTRQNNITGLLIQYIRDKANAFIEENIGREVFGEIFSITTEIYDRLEQLKASEDVKSEEGKVKDVFDDFSTIKIPTNESTLVQNPEKTLERLLAINDESLLSDLLRIQIFLSNTTTVKRWGAVVSVLSKYLQLKGKEGSRRDSTRQTRRDLKALGDLASEANEAISKLQSSDRKVRLDALQTLGKNIKKLADFHMRNKATRNPGVGETTTGVDDSQTQPLGKTTKELPLVTMKPIHEVITIKPPEVFIQTTPAPKPFIPSLIIQPPAIIKLPEITSAPEVVGVILPDSLPALSEMFMFKSRAFTKELTVTDNCKVTWASDGCAMSFTPNPDDCLNVNVIIEKVLNTVSGIAEALQLGSVGDNPIDLSDLVVKYFEVNVCDEIVTLSVTLFADREITLIPTTLSVTNIEIDLTIAVPDKSITVSFSATWDLGGVSFTIQAGYDRGEYDITARPVTSDVTLATLLGSVANAVVPGDSTSASAVFNDLKFNSIVISDMSLVAKFTDSGMGFQFSFTSTISGLGSTNIMLNFNRLKEGGNFTNAFSLAALLKELTLASIIQHIGSYDISTVPLIGSLAFPEVAIIGASKDIPELIVDFTSNSDIISLLPSVSKGIALLFSARFDTDSDPMNFMVKYTPPKSIGFRILPGPQLDVEGIINKLLTSINLQLPPGFPLATFLNQGLSNMNYNGEINELNIPVILGDDIVIVKHVFEIKEPEIDFVIGLGKPRTLSFVASGTWLIKDYPIALTISKPPGESEFLASACSEKPLEVGKVMAQLASSFLPDFVGNIFETFSIENPCFEILIGRNFGVRVSGTAVIGSFDASKVEVLGGKVDGAMLMALGIVLEKTRLSSVIDKLTKGNVDITSMPGSRIFDESSIGLVMSTHEIPTIGRSELKFRLAMLSNTNTLDGVSFVVHINLPPSSDCSGDFLCLVLNKFLPGLSMIMKGRLAINDLLLEVTIPREIEIAPGFMLSGLGFRIIVRPPLIEVALIASLIIDDPALRFTGAIGFSTTGGATLEMAMVGCWPKPFAIPIVTICDLFIKIGIVPEPTVISELHLGGRAQIGLIDNSKARLFNASLFIGLNKIVPSESYFLGKISKLTIPAILAAFAYFPSLPKALDEIGFPDGLDVSYTQLLSGKVLPNGVTIPSGLRFNGTIQIMSFKVSSRMRMDINGIFVFLTVDRFNIGNNLISVDGDGKSGPELLVDVGWNPPRAKIDIQGKVCVLKICASVNITVDSQGIHFEIGGKFLDLFEAQLTLTASYTSLDSATFSVSGYFKQTLLDTLKNNVISAISDLSKKATAALDTATKGLDSARQSMDSAAEDLRAKKAVVDGIQKSINTKAQEISDQKEKVDYLESKWKESVRVAEDQVEKLEDAKAEITKVQNEIKKIEDNCPAGCSSKRRKRSIRRGEQSGRDDKIVKDSLLENRLDGKASKSFLHSQTKRIISAIIGNRIQDRQKRFIGGGFEFKSPWESGREAAENVAERIRLEDAREAVREKGREAGERTRETAENARERTVERGREFSERTREVAAERTREFRERTREAAEKLRLERVREVAVCKSIDAARATCLLPIKGMRFTLEGLKSSFFPLQSATDFALKVAKDNNLAFDAAKLTLVGLEESMKGLASSLEGPKRLMDAAATVLEQSQFVFLTAKVALDGVNRLQKAGLNAASFITKFGLGSVINIKELRFNVALAVAETGEFSGTIVVSFLGRSDDTFSFQIKVKSVEDMVDILVNEVEDLLKL